MNRKYELTNETIKYNGRILHRIRALRDFRDVKAGNLGGFVENEKNLSHHDNCWIYDNAKVFGCAEIGTNAKVRDCAEVCDDAQVYGDAEVYGNANINCMARVFENARVGDNAHIYGYAWVYGDAIIDGDIVIREGEISETNKPSLSDRIANAQAKQTDANVGKDTNIERENER